MKIQIIPIIFAAAATATSCNQDNALRCLLSNTPVAVKFCSSYLSIPVVTSTVSTYTPVTTTFLVSTTTSTVAPNLKRDVLDECNAAGCFPKITARTVPTSSPAPACLSATYPASRISSACSCLSIVPSTKSVTATAKVSTSTVLSTTTTTTTAQSIPTTFQIIAHAPGTAADGVPLGGILDENFFTGFNLPWGTPFQLTLDTTTGWVHSGDIYLNARFTDGLPGSPAWVMTNTLEFNPPDIDTALTCSINTDLSLHCAGGDLFQFQLWQYLGDGIPRLAIAREGDTSIEGFIANVQLSVVPV